MARLAWDSLVANAPASVVLPVRPRGAALTVPGPLQLVDCIDLDDACVAIVQDASGSRWVSPLVANGTAVRRALPGDGVAALLASSLMPSRVSGRFTFTSWHSEPVSGEQPITVDQTNESVIVGDAAVVKWTLRLPPLGEPGSPAAVRMTALANAEFDAMPRPWGVVTWNDGTAELPIATVASYVHGAEDGWDWAVRDVGEYARGLTAETPLEAARTLGAIAAHMHQVFASTGVDHADVERATNWRLQALADLVEAESSVDGEERERLSARSARMQAHLDCLGDATGTPLIDIHGDFHVGQILRAGEPHEYVVTDFDGSPVLGARERVAKQPAAVDVVSMIASLDHVGRVVIKRVEGADAAKVRAWITSAQAEFLTSYRDALGEVRFAELVDESLFEPLRLQQECREYIYAAQHLPHWRYVPDMALQDLLPGEE
jgi:maltokinase